MTSHSTRREPDPLAVELLPEFDVESSHSIWVSATPEATYAATRHLDLSGSRLVRWLFRLRGMPRSALTLDGLARIRFKPLVEDPPNAFALGLIGQFWRASGRLLDFDPATFTTARHPEFAKAIWLFRVHPESGQRCELVTTTRVYCMDPESRRRFLRYWKIIAPFSGVIRRQALQLARDAAEAKALNPLQGDHR